MTEQELVRLLKSNPDLQTDDARNAQPSKIAAPARPGVRRAAMRPIILTLHNERAPGWNKTLRVHWTDRDALVAQMWARIFPAMPARYSLFECPVDVHVVATFKGTPLDSDNICAKLYIDALKGKLLHDDNPRYIRRVMTESRHGKANSVIITLTPIEGSTL